MSQAASSTSSSERPVVARRLLLAGLAGSLAGCGFRPLNGPPAAGEADIAPELAAVRIGRTFARTAQLLHQALHWRLTPQNRSAPAPR